MLRLLALACPRHLTTRQPNANNRRTAYREQLATLRFPTSSQTLQPATGASLFRSGKQLWSPDKGTKRSNQLPPLSAQLTNDALQKHNTLAVRPSLQVRCWQHVASTTPHA